MGNYELTSFSAQKSRFGLLCRYSIFGACLSTFGFAPTARAETCEAVYYGVTNLTPIADICEAVNQVSFCWATSFQNNSVCNDFAIPGYTLSPDVIAPTPWPGNGCDSDDKCFAWGTTSIDPALPNCGTDTATSYQLCRAVDDNREQGQNCSVGNPIVIGSRNKYETVSDYSGVGILPLQIRRYYNSLDKRWRFSYSRQIETISATEVRVRKDDGNGQKFSLVGSTWESFTDNPQQLVDNGTGWTLTLPNDDEEVYDTSGQLLSIANRAGNTITISYGTGTITVTHFSGRQLVFTLDASNRVNSISAPGSYAYQYTYDLYGQLNTVIYPVDVIGNPNPTLTYHYEDTNNSGLLTGKTDELGNRIGTYSYDAYGRAILTEGPGGANKFDVIKLDADTVKTINPLGKETTYSFIIRDGVRKLSSVDGAATALCGAMSSSIDYDANGYVASRTDRNGNVTDFTRNGKGLIESKVEAVGDPEARTTTTTWHANFQVPTQIVRSGQTEDMTYDAQGRLLSRTLTDTQTQTIPYITTGNTRTWAYTYNATGLVATIDGPRTDASDITTFTYDVNGDLLTTNNSLGHVTEIVSRNARGLPTVVDDANDLRTEMGYDARGKLTSRTIKSSQGDITTTFSYNLAGLLTRIDLPSGAFLAYEYDAAQRLVAVENDLQERIEYTLDAAGNATKTENKGPGGTIVQIQDQVFDELSRLRTWVDGANNNTALVYDDNGNLTDTTDALTRTNNQVFDGLDRVKTVTDATSGDTQFAYDGRGNLISVTDPRNVVTSYIYDGLDDLIQETSADAGTSTYLYDAAGNVTQSTDARSVVTNYTYDALNRMLTAIYPTSSGENVTYTYDSGTNSLGRLTNIADGSGSTDYTYDDRGNTTQDNRTIDGTTYVTGYAYNLSDQLVSQTYPSGRVVNVGRDSQGRSDSITHTINNVTEYLVDGVQYDGQGITEVIALGNGLYQSAQTDLAGRPTTRTLTEAYNASPVAYTDSATTDVGQSVVIDVILNDKDFNGDALTIYNVTQPSNGTVAINGDQTITYTSTGATQGTDSFAYQVTDGLSPSNVADVTIMIVDAGFLDTDGDGLGDALEVSVGLDPNDASDTVADADGDGVDNYAEYLAGTDPLVNDSGYSAAVLGLSPMAFWKFDETSGSTLVDASTNGLNGVYYSQYTLGETSIQLTGTAASYTGLQYSGGFVNVLNNAQIEFVGDYTIEGFFRWTNNSTGLLVHKYKTVSGEKLGVITYVLSDGRVQLRESNAAAFNSITTGMNDGQWRYLTFVRRGTQMEIWINGELDSTKIISQPDTSNTTGLFVMGSYHFFGQRINGASDDLALHSSALSPAQIKAHFRSQGDKDLDTVPTNFEMANHHDPLDASDATKDYDGDGATLYDEYIAQTDPMIHPSGFGASILADSPEGYWPLEDVTTVVADSSPNGHSGTYYPPYTQSQSPATTTGDSVDFTGGRIEIPHDNSLNFSGDFTIEMYLKWAATDWARILDKRSTASIVEGPQLYVNYSVSTGVDDGRLAFRVRSSNTYAVSTQTDGLNDNIWRLFTFVRRGGELEIWIDGSLDAKSTLPSVDAFTSTDPLQIMDTSVLSSKPVVGSLDEVAVYAHALSAADIVQRFIQGKEPPPFVKTKSQQLPRKLDRWLEPGTLIALHDERAPNIELFRVVKNGGIERVADVSVDLIAKATIRATRDDSGVSVYMDQSKHQQWLHKRLPNGVRKGLVPVASGGLSETWSYTYDAVSNITQIAKPGGTDLIGYDALDQLNTYTLPSSAAVTYTYDALGNRTSETQAGVTLNHTYGTTDNRLMTQTGSALTYDAAGNKISDQAGVRTFAYNDQGRLTSVVDNSVTVGTYAYNALGQRVRKVANGQDIDFVYDLNGQLIGEYDSGAMVKEYIYLDGIPAMQIEGTQVTYLHADHLGTPRVGTDENGVIVWRWDSDPFGAASPDEDPDGDSTQVTVNLRFPGQYADMETGTYYNYFRTYDPSIGRYTTSDPIGLNGGLNSYAYVGGRPVTNSDQLGLRASYCQRPLGDWSGQNAGGPPVLNHQFICVTLLDGTVRCDSTSNPADDANPFFDNPFRPIPGVPSLPERDNETVAECTDIDDNQDRCFEDCVLEQWDRPRPGYAIGPFGTDCQEYSSDIVEACNAVCPATDSL